jgi:hypothetical protein
MLGQMLMLTCWHVACNATRVVSAVRQMFGLVAELRRYGKATFGYRFFRELDYQLDLSQTLINRRDKQVQA